MAAGRKKQKQELREVSGCMGFIIYKELRGKAVCFVGACM